jgi:DNA end-binding protein Ku
VRAMWKGSVSFGLVNVPVKMYTATQSNDVSFHQVHREDGGRIRYKRICSVCGEEVPYDEIAKGYEADDGQLVILTDEDLADLPVHGSREIEVERFVPAEQIDPLLLEKSYYLSPENTGRKPYALLREVLEQTDRMALVHVAIRSRSTLAVLRVRDDVIVLQTMMWPDEIRRPDFENLPDGSDLRPQELAMASSLVDSLTGDYEPEEFVDDYREAVETMIQRKLETGDAQEEPGEKEAAASGGGEVIDLLAALQRSVDEASARRGGATSSGSSGSEGSAKKAAPKKAAASKSSGTSKKASATAKKASAPAKKAAAKKTASKKTAAKKTAARKSA